MLKVKKTATDAEIKKSFKKLAIQYHPDKNTDDPDAAKDKFQKIANAYEVLSDPEKRKIYDLGGEEAVQEDAQRQGQQNMNQHDIFSHFFGGGGHGFHQQR